MQCKWQPFEHVLRGMVKTIQCPWHTVFHALHQCMENAVSLACRPLYEGAPLLHLLHPPHWPEPTCYSHNHLFLFHVQIKTHALIWANLAPWDLKLLEYLRKEAFLARIKSSHFWKIVLTWLSGGAWLSGACFTCYVSIPTSSIMCKICCCRDRLVNHTSSQFELRTSTNKTESEKEKILLSCQVPATQFEANSAWLDGQFLSTEAWVYLMYQRWQSWRVPLLGSWSWSE